MKQQIMKTALAALDAKLSSPLTLLIGGGAAMLLAHQIPLSTMDIDGLPTQSGIDPGELDRFVKEVAKELKINAHWLNSYFNTFTYTIPRDYKTRIVGVFKGKHLLVNALGKEDLLIMKCFSGREKDIGHARALILKNVDIDFVDNYIQGLADKNFPGASEALDFLDDVKEQVGI